MYRNKAGRKMARNILKLLFFITAISILPTSISAQKKAAAKKRLAVIKIQSVKEQAVLARLVRNRIELDLFKTGSFDILERDQIDFVMKEQKIKPESLSDDKAAARLGEFIAADYIVLGRIEKREHYNLNIRIVEVKSNRIAISEESEFAAPAGAGQAIARLVKKLEKRILSLGTVKEGLSFKRDFYFSAGYLYLSPQGKFKDIMGSGYGISLSAGLNSVLIDNLRVGISLNLFNFDGDGENTDKARMFPVMLEAGYVISYKKMFLIPLLDLGFGNNTNYHYLYTSGDETEKKSSLQFMTAAGFNAGYALSEFLLIEANFKSWQIYEEEQTNMFWGVGFSVGMQF